MTDDAKEIERVERTMNLIAMINKMDSLAELDAAGIAIAKRTKEWAKERAKTMLPTFALGDLVLVDLPGCEHHPDQVPLAGRVTRVGTKLYLDLKLQDGAEISVPVVRCRKVQQ